MSISSFNRWLLGGMGLLLISVLLLAVAGSYLISILVGTLGITMQGQSPPTESNSVALSQTWTGQQNQAVVEHALAIASALYTGPPDGHTTWYLAEQIPEAVAYWQESCPGACAVYWAQGNLQCTMLVTASYALAGQPVPFAGDAVTWWSWHPYRHQPGWQEVPATALPIPGDIIVWSSGSFFGGAGHVAIVMDVKSPDTQGTGGYVQFAQSNGTSALEKAVLTRDASSGALHMQTWPGYTVLGYLRHQAFVS